jgi:hypothetical protein
MAVVAPMPRARVMTPVAANPGEFFQLPERVFEIGEHL